MPVSQAMTTSVGEKRKRPNGKVFEEPPVIPCTAEELNHVLDKWIGDGVVLGHQLRKKGRIPCFAGFIIMLNIPSRIARPSIGSFTKS